MASLLSCLGAALDGQGGLALVGGDTGIGTSAIVEAIAHAAVTASCVVQMAFHTTNAADRGRLLAQVDAAFGRAKGALASGLTTRLF